MKTLKAIRTLTTAFAAFLSICSCQEKYPDPENFVGFIEQSYTRTSYTSDENSLKTAWEGGDYIIVMKNCTEARQYPEEYCCTYMASQGGECVNLIQMDVNEPASPYVAYYPQEVAFGELPDEQHYRPDGPDKAPMIAKSPTRYLMFRPMCGAIEFMISSKLGNAVVKSITLETEQKLCGLYDIVDDVKAVAMGGKSITLKCTNGVELGSEPKPFYFYVPENNYTGVILTLKMTDGRTEEFRINAGRSIEVTRAKVTVCPVNDYFN